MPTLQDWTDFQNDLMGHYQTLFAFHNVLHSLMSGAVKQPGGVATYDPAQARITPLSAQGRGRFEDGAKIRFPLMLGDVAGAAGTGRGGTFTVTGPIDTSQATCKLAELTAPIGVDLYLANNAKNGSLTARAYVEELTASAYRGLARVENDMLHGDGSGLLAKNTAADATGLTMTVAGANFDQLTPKRVVTVAATADGTVPAGGHRRKIKSVNRTAETVTFDTAAYADGDSGNVSLAAAAAGTWGIYIDSTYDVAAANGKAMQGFGQVFDATQDFEGVDHAAVDFVGASVDNGAAALDDDALDNIVYLLAGNGVDAPDFGVGHPKTIDPYKASKTQFLHVQPQEAIVPSGWRGVVYQGANRDVPLIKDLAAPRKTVRLFVNPGPSGQIYGNGAGPEFIQDDGGMWRFFDRATYKEAAIVDWVQLAIGNPRHYGEITNLAEA